MKAKIRDTEIYFDVEGCGLVPDGSTMREKAIAFLVHGGPGADHSSYKLIFSPLSQYLQLVYFDHRGQGRSARGDKHTYTLDNNVEDMEALRQYLGLDKIIVIGTSYGGMVALTYAIRYPDNVAKLIIIASAASSIFLDKAKTFLQEKGTPEQKKMAEYLWNGNFADEKQLEKYFQVTAPLYSVNSNPEKAEETFSGGILSVDAINVAFSGFLKTYNVVDDLGKINAPTLVIGAEYDWICPPECSTEIAQGIPHAKLEIIKDSGHLIRTDQPEILLEIITDFITE